MKKYGFEPHAGLYTDMNAIRRDEDTDNIHSIYVDQWDWEKIIKKEDRTMDFLKKTVEDIYEVFKTTEEALINAYPEKKLERTLPEKISFITSQDQSRIRKFISRKKSKRKRKHNRERKRCHIYFPNRKKIKKWSFS